MILFSVKARKYSFRKLLSRFNWTHIRVPFPFPLKTWENQMFSDAFRRYRNRTLAWNWREIDVKLAWNKLRKFRRFHLILLIFASHLWKIINSKWSMCAFHLKMLSKGKKIFETISKCVVLCVIWYHSYNFKNVKKTHGGVFLSVKLQAEACNFT